MTRSHKQKVKREVEERCHCFTAQRGKRFLSLLSVENGFCAKTKKVVEVKGKWVNIRATMDTGAAGHVMPKGMFPRLNLKLHSHFT